ncbi:TetR family transcriptional regulator [Streptomyces hainanensis]|uniref:TetR family transcriptional regulator n=1 Tax=Streptomyces hainanensis TaxID=402648 RepID=A0A4V2Y3P9_9ACTN|nr:TetR family transcriptional regulator [Streptomyces hainanensis]TDC77315.1 TetR family transcriptional regulator [Streptomyces hainanensis]
MRNDEEEPGGLRERTRRAVRDELARLALDLFTTRGYEETTVEDVARAASMSKRSFFRYFPTKEDVVFGELELMAARIAEEIRARPADEPPWRCLTAVLAGWQDRIHAAQRELPGLRLIESSPALRARLAQKRDELRALVADALRARPGAPLDAFTADLLTGAAGTALDAAAREWLRTGGQADRATLLTRAFALLEPPGAGGAVGGTS